jgi:hypothetical protein
MNAAAAKALVERIAANFSLKAQAAIIAEITDADVDLKKAIKKVLEGFDTEVFIRNTAHDGDPDWALKLLPYLRAVGTLAAEVDDP